MMRRREDGEGKEGGRTGAVVERRRPTLLMFLPHRHQSGRKAALGKAVP